MTPITVTTWPDEGTRTQNSACVWVAETMVEGRVYVARSRHGAPTELARQLVAAGLADRPMVISYRGLAGTMTWRSFHAAATWTYSEGDQPLRRVRYKERLEGLFLGSGTGQKCVSSPAADVLKPSPLDRLKTQAAETRMPEHYDLTLLDPDNKLGRDIAIMRTDIEELHANLARMPAVIARAALGIIFCTAGITTLLSCWFLTR